MEGGNSVENTRQDNFSNYHFCGLQSITEGHRETTGYAALVTTMKGDQGKEKGLSYVERTQNWFYM